MNAIEEIAAERKRQIETEGWTEDHDDRYAPGKLARAGAVYAAIAFLPSEEKASHQATLRWIPSFCRSITLDLWPFLGSWFKPTNARRDLIKAAALIVAEIEKLDRETARG